MEISPELNARSEHNCELCNDPSLLNVFIVSPKSGISIDHQVAICDTCKKQLDQSDLPDEHHWHCVNESIWSPVPAIQVVSYRMLHKFKDKAWAQDLLSLIDLDPYVLEWAEDMDNPYAVRNTIHKDSNGNILQQGDTVVFIQDLNVKGANLVAKRGTPVRRITLVHDNPEQIEGRVNDQQIVILTRYVRKSG